MTAALLAAIHADPDDLAARAVYGDWLSEQQDPRGELIALQLSGATSKTAAARIAKLIDEHGDAWSAPLDAWFEPAGRRFVAGFFAGGALRFPGDRMDPATIAGEPAWRLVRLLESTWTNDAALTALAEHPQLCGLRELRWLSSTTAARLLAAPRRWTDVSVWLDDPAPLLATLDTLPDLRTLGLAIRDSASACEWISRAPVLARVERVRLFSRNDLADAIAAAATREGALRSVLVEAADAAGRLAPWTVELSRDAASGPFTRAVARHPGGTIDPLQLLPSLAVLPATLHELEVVTGRKPVVRASERKAFTQAIARFGSLERRVLPWDDAAPAPKRRTGLERYELHFEGENLFDRGALTAMWQLAAGELAQPYDAFEVGEGTALHKIGDDPLERIATWSQRTDRLRLVHDGGTESFELRRIGSFERVLIQLATDRSPDDVAAWLSRFATAARFRTGACTAGKKPIYERFDLGVLRLGVLGGWLTWFGAPLRDVLPPAIEGGTLTPDGVLVRATETARDATKQRLAAVAAALADAVVAALPAKLGFDFAAEVTGALGEQLAALGFQRAETDHWTRLAFVKRGKLEHRAEIAIERVDDFNLPATLLAPMIHAKLTEQRRGDAREPAKLELGRGTVANREQLVALIGQIRDALAARLAV